MNAPRTGITLTIALRVGFTLSACGSGSSVTADPWARATDYSVPAHWLSLPATIDKNMDVLCLIPTAWTSSDPHPQICTC